MVTASVLLIHYSSPRTGQAARGSTRTTYTVSLIQLFISLPLIIEIMLGSERAAFPNSAPPPDVRNEAMELSVNISVESIDKTPGRPPVLLFITGFNEKLLHTLHVLISDIKKGNVFSFITSVTYIAR